MQKAYIDYAATHCGTLSGVKENRKFYYHCDWHASHYVKVMLDNILVPIIFKMKLFGKELRLLKLNLKHLLKHTIQFFLY